MNSHWKGTRLENALQTGIVQAFNSSYFSHDVLEWRGTIFTSLAENFCAKFHKKSILRLVNYMNMHVLYTFVFCFFFKSDSLLIMALFLNIWIFCKTYNKPLNRKSREGKNFNKILQKQFPQVISREEVKKFYTLEKMQRTCSVLSSENNYILVA